MKTYLELEEIQNLENAALFLRDKLLIRVLSHLGCRISEALALEVKDINFNASTITILHLKSRININCTKCNAQLGKSHTFCPKCGNKVDDIVTRVQEHQKVRTLPLDSETLGLLKDYIKQGGPIKKNGKVLIFGVSRHRGWQIIGECATRAGLPKLVNPETGRTHNISPHKLRDAFAVHAVKLNDSGDGLRLLQEHLGHANFNTTAKYRKVSGNCGRME
jgi:integrase/recombinase XerD